MVSTPAVVGAISRSRSLPAFRMRAQLEGMKMDISSMYRNALLNPFDPYVAGVKIPEPFPCFTTTYKLQGSIAVTSPNGTESGGFLLRPSPCAAFVDTGAVASLPATSRFTVTTSLPAYGSNPGVYGVPGSALNQTFTTFRVVTAGFKISVTQPIGTTGGRTGWLYAAPIPTQLDFPGDVILAQIPVSAPYASRLLDRMAVSTVSGASILELPGAIKINLGEVGSQTILLSDRPTSFNYANFYATDESAQLTSTVEEASDVAIVNSTGAVSTTVSVQGLTGMPGHTTYVVWFEGLPGVGQPLVEVEYIMHLEGVPSPGAALSVVPTGPEIASKGNWLNILESVPKVGMAVLDIAREYGPMVARLAQAYGNMKGSVQGYKTMLT